jgi:hypothetical protein
MLQMCIYLRTNLKVPRVIDLNTTLMAKIVLMPYTFTQILVSELKNFQLFAAGFRWENGGYNLPLSLQ